MPFITEISVIMRTFYITAKSFLLKYIDVNFFLRFSILLAVIYYFNVFFIRIVDKKEAIYCSFIDNNLNYMSCIRYFILYTSNAIAHVFGVNSYVLLPDYLKSVNHYWIRVEPACLGLSLMSFWVAFILANKETVKRKIVWCSAGLIGLSIINSIRITFLLMAFEYNWQRSSFLLNHTLSKLAFYSLMVFMIYFYTKNGQKYFNKIA